MGQTRRLSDVLGMSALLQTADVSLHRGEPPLGAISGHALRIGSTATAACRVIAASVTAPIELRPLRVT
jgi:hypothetical protein